MAKFEFYQDTEIKAWNRHYFEVEAESLEEAIALIQNEGKSLDELEMQTKRVQWYHHDDNLIYDTMRDLGKWHIYSNDLEHEGKESEILSKE
jgi:hypothetical protein